MLLFFDVDFKEVYVLFVIVKFEFLVVVSKNYINIFVGKNDYMKCLCNGLVFGFLWFIDVIGSEYIVVNINGNLIFIFMILGNDVMGRVEWGGINIKKGLILFVLKV